MTRTGMTCARFDDLLAEYLEETSEAGVRKAMDAHRVDCLRCAAVVRDIAKIRMDAGGLPDLTPSRDLWSGISERIDREVVAAPHFGAAQSFSASSFGRGQPNRRASFMKWGVAAAALMAVTSGVTYYAAMARVQRRTIKTVAVGRDSVATMASNRLEPASPSAPNVAPPSLGQAPAPFAGANVLPASTHAPRISAMVTYDREIAGLRNMLAQRRVDLDPGTVAVIEHSLTTIDNAIHEARTALASDPASRFLREQLDKALEKKLGLLRTVALLPARA
jgi:hypothetical protein